jgi:hypothetical protein
MAQYRLPTEIIRLSNSDIWDAAKLEWKLEEIYEATEPGTCLCGHYPIIEICVLRNKWNGNGAVVGNVCVKKFIGLPSDKIFEAVKRIRKDSEKSLNAEAIQYAHDRHWIDDWQKNFYIRIMRKHILSPKQAAKKIQINEKVLRNMQRRVQTN